MGTVRVWGAMAMVLVACSSKDQEPPFTCAIGELTGTWRISYVETNGTCGDVADETAVLSPGASTAAATCQENAFDIAPDKCRVDLDYECPLTGASGSQRWTGTLRQTAAGRLSGSMTVQAVATSGWLTDTCRSSYDVTWTRL